MAGHEKVRTEAVSGLPGGEGSHEGSWLIAVLVALIGAFMAILDSSIVNVALPTMMRVFNTDTATIEWVVTIYMLALGVVVPLSGWLGDKLGFKLLYILSLGVFTLGSLLCTISWNVDSMIAARVIQALGGGMIMPTTMSIIYRLVPREKQGSAMGLFGMAMIVAPAIGPTLGGYLVEYVDWRWIFTINLPVGLLGVILSWFYLPAFPSREAGRLDIGGAVTAAVGLFCLLLALSKGGDWGWSSEAIVLLFYTSAVSLGLFVYLELTQENPLLDLRVFRYLTFTLGNVIVIVTSIGLFAGVFYISFFLQVARGLGAMETGLITMPGALASGLVMPLTGWLYDRLGPRPLAVAGMLWLGWTTYIFHNIDVITPTSTLYLWVILRGLGMSLAMMPAQTAALSVVPAELVGRASAITNIINRVSSSFGIAVLTTVLNNRAAMHAAHLANGVTASSLAAGEFFRKAGLLLGGGSTAGDQARTLAAAYLQGIIARTAFVRAIDDVFIIAALIVLVGLLPAFFLQKGSGAARATFGSE
ncbi:Tetracycline resistance protein TetB/drug resistance transporter [Moorella glycerini]|uniref:Multidrug export protein EmrB n=1 Tax=Neomoorella stamsii TaxID=1266720 RepID=A0A9X7J0J9_9FIRM|nr:MULTISPECIES: DHA2 family efflux MFS transporter permease subunit [Moorella]PRR69970.1 Multidrug export protein EmrB [Moorella stamsii]CEP68479.1 Tetracycline resistance protein TetB/drug resistance transporter [Moorella glycerini]